jgi:hypothetical protein
MRPGWLRLGWSAAGEDLPLSLKRGGVRSPAGRSTWQSGVGCKPSPQPDCGRLLHAFPLKYHNLSGVLGPVFSGREEPGSKPGTHAPLPAGVSFLDGWRKRQGDRVLSPHGPTGDSVGPRFEHGSVEVAMLRRQETKAVESGNAFSVRRPLQIEFESPADRSRWLVKLVLNRVRTNRPHVSL